MDSPWGLNGPDYLLAYALVLAMLCGCLFAVRAQAKEKQGWTGEKTDPGLYARAYLNGASGRVADTALAGLIELGAVRVNRRRELYSTGRRPADDVQRQLLEGLGDRSTVSRVRAQFKESEYCDSLLHLLREDRLIVSARHRTMLLVLLWGFPVLMLINVVRAVNGAELGFPIGGLIIELAITLFVWLFAAGKCGHPMPTDAGDAVVRPRTGKHAESGTQDHAFRLPEDDAANQVAAYGLSAYPDRTIAELLEPPNSARGGRAGGVGGGGGCGGGGGGGCGGGGGG